MSANAAEKIVDLGFESHENDMPRDDWERLMAMSDEDLERSIALGLFGSGSDPRSRMARAIRVMRRQERMDLDLTSWRIATEDLRDAAEEARTDADKAMKLVRISFAMTAAAVTVSIGTVALLVFF